MFIPTVKDIQQLEKRPARLLTIKENATVAEAAKKMSKNRVGCLVVFDMQNKFTGVLTERDMLEKVLTTLLAPKNLLVSEIMTTDPISCTMDSTVEEVEQLMAEHKIRHLPIVDGDTPIAMVSSRDLIAYQLQTNKAMKAAAEQLAMLSTELKSPNLKDVIGLAVNEAPKTFDADRAVLCLDQKASSDLVIYRKDCDITRKELLEPAKITQLSQNEQLIYGQICDQCRKIGAKAPKLVIPLDIRDQANGNGDNNINRQSFLCMCRFKPASDDAEKLRLYKASLLQEILSINLTNAKLYQQYLEARQDSEIDPLTGTGSRRALENALKTEYARAARYHRPFSIAIVDLDNFKEINDTAGHAAGDRALRELAKSMRRNARMTDTIIARYGGDEFVLLMPETNIAEATVLLERLQQEVKNISIPKVGSITISCGLAEWTINAGPDETAESLLRRADTALYEAKRAGRNRTITADSVNHQ